MLQLPIYALSLPPTGTMATVTQKHFLEGQTYSVPLIQPDLRREEAIHQVADALQYLQKVSSDIFSRYVAVTRGTGTDAECQAGENQMLQ